MKTILSMFPLFLACICVSCSLQRNAPFDMKKKGFITPNCYQVLVQFDPDEGATGLVERRDSSLLKAKKSDARAMLLDTLAAYCIETRLHKFNINPVKNRLDMEKIKNKIIPQLTPYAARGKCVFVYYNEQMAVIMAYRISGKNLQSEMESIIDSIELVTIQ